MNDRIKIDCASPADRDALVAILAHAVRGQQRYTVEAIGGEKRKWTADMWEDYRAADVETQRMLLKKWGDPQ